MSTLLQFMWALSVVTFSTFSLLCIMLALQ
jgi:hypothetical protein